MLAPFIGAGIAAGTALLVSLRGLNTQWKEQVDPAIDQKWMQASIDAMPKCHFLPYGSVIVNATSNELLCSGYNHEIETGDPTEHGEVNAIRNCVKKYTDLGWSTQQIKELWPQTWIYTTAEPCPMCGAVILHSGFRRVVYGTSQPAMRRLGWTEYLVTLRTDWLRRLALIQPGFGTGRPVTDVVEAWSDMTDPLLSWQWDASYPCPEGCERDLPGEHKDEAPEGAAPVCTPVTQQ